tara:strand:+ start:41 stop:235 length:195 start_codon:yes stop_codon:yes gene_type:complete
MKDITKLLLELQKDIDKIHEDTLGHIEKELPKYLFEIAEEELIASQMSIDEALNQVIKESEVRQ